MILGAVIVSYPIIRNLLENRRNSRDEKALRNFFEKGEKQTKRVWYAPWRKRESEFIPGTRTRMPVRDHNRVREEIETGVDASDELRDLGEAGGFFPLVITVAYEEKLEGEVNKLSPFERKIAGVEAELMVLDGVYGRIEEVMEPYSRLAERAELVKMTAENWEKDVKVSVEGATEAVKSLEGEVASLSDSVAGIVGKVMPEAQQTQSPDQGQSSEEERRGGRATGQRSGPAQEERNTRRNAVNRQNGPGQRNQGSGRE